MNRNIAAFTETHHSAPGYISINEQDDGMHKVSVRTRTTGSFGIISMTEEQLVDLAYEILNSLEKPKAPSVVDAITHNVKTPKK